MGLAAFQRARMERKEVEMLESERFDKDNKARQEARLLKDRPRRQLDDEQDKIFEADLAAGERIGAKAEEGLTTPVADFPLRADHTAALAGEKDDPDFHSEPHSAVERLEARLPESERPSQNELKKLVASTPEVAAADLQERRADKKAKDSTDLPAAGTSAGVRAEEPKAVDARKDAEAKAKSEPQTADAKAPAKDEPRAEPKTQPKADEPATPAAKPADVKPAAPAKKN